MNHTDAATQQEYDRKYQGSEYYWSLRPSSSCLEVLMRMPPEKRLKRLDVGCGDGRNAVFSPAVATKSPRSDEERGTVPVVIHVMVSRLEALGEQLRQLDVKSRDFR